MSGLAVCCGLSFGRRNETESSLDEMLEALDHRGPDIRWQARFETASLGLCQQLETETPYHRYYAENGDSACILDGSIYDPGGPEAFLRRVLESTSSTAELAELLACTKGKFTLAVQRGNETILARDVLGFQPLYYAEKKGDMFFASEIKALSNLKADVKEFPPAHLYSTDTGWRRFADAPWSVQSETFKDEREAMNALVYAIEEAVKRRLEDGRVKGVFLSGGLDSSIVAFLANKHLGTVHTFTVGMEGGEDVERARQVAHYLGTEHHELLYTKNDVLRVLPEVVYHFESYVEDFMRGSVATYFASQLARDYTPAVLCGEGPDELFAGYHDFKDIGDWDDLDALLPRIMEGLHRAGCQRLDRMASAHQLEVRAPFLDEEVVREAFRIPIEWKLQKNPETGTMETEKWILRKAFEGCLPDNIIWRKKAQFAKGAGSLDLMKEHAERCISDEEFAEALQSNDTPKLKSKEELYYYRIFSRFYGSDLAHLVGRWEPMELVR